MEMTIRYGLIGYGRWGAQHAAAIRAAEGAELSAVATSSPQTAEVAGEEQAVDAYSDYRELLARDDIDVVDIVLPNHLHHEVAMASLRAGKHLLLEKPMALTTEHCREIVDEAERRDLKIHVGHELRYSALWRVPREMIDDGRLGDLKSAQIHLSRHPFRPGSSGWRTDLERVGSWILEEPVHFYDLVVWYFQGAQRPAKVFAVGNSRDPRLESEGLYENMNTSIGFSGGGFGVVSQSLAAYEHHLTAEFVGMNGVLKLWWSGATDRDQHPSFGIELFDGQETSQLSIEGIPGELQELHDQIADYTDVLARDGRPKVTGEDALWSVQLSEAAQTSIREEAIVRLE